MLYRFRLSYARLWVYRVAVIAEVYGCPVALERLVDGVGRIVVGLAEHVAQRLLARDGSSQNELLESPLATLRLGVGEQAQLARTGSAEDSRRQGVVP